MDVGWPQQSYRVGAVSYSSSSHPQRDWTPKAENGVIINNNNNNNGNKMLTIIIQVDKIIDDISYVAP